MILLLLVRLFLSVALFAIIAPPSCWGFDLQGVISPDSSNFLQKYAMLKLYESCLGLKTIHKAKLHIKEATAICYRRPEMLLSITQSAGMGEAGATSSTAAKVNRNPWMHKYVDSNPYKTPAVLQAQYAPQRVGHYTPMMYQFPSYYAGRAATPYSVRGKRHSDGGGGGGEGFGIDSLKADILSKLSNITCILTEVGVLKKDDPSMIDTQGIKAELAEMEVDPIMRAELVKAVDTCQKFSSCLPLDEFENVPVGKEIAPAIMFINCLRGKKIEACVKNDLRQRFMQFVQNGVSPDQMDAMMARTEEESTVTRLSMSDEDVETLVFGLLYENEPSSLP